MSHVSLPALVCAALLNSAASESADNGAWSVRCGQGSCSVAQSVRDPIEPRWWMSLVFTVSGDVTKLNIAVTPPLRNRVLLQLRGGSSWTLEHGECSFERCVFTEILTEERRKELSRADAIAVMTDDLSSRFPVGFIFKLDRLSEVLTDIDRQRR